MKTKLNFKISPTVFKDLLEIQEKLPKMATGATKAGAADSYDHPAGMALLGLKDGRLDTVVNLAMSGGCWDAPNINHKDFDKGFRKMIESDRIVTGIALIRHPKWNIEAGSARSGHIGDAKLPQHLKVQIHGLRTAFADITATVWIVLHNDYFRLYQPYKDVLGRINIREITGQKLFNDVDKSDAIVKSKYESDKKAVEYKIQKKKEEEELKELKRQEQIAREERENKRIQAIAKKAKANSDQIKLDLKEGKKDIIYAGNGLSYVKEKNGVYILWQTGK